jgi:hypothetical protein
MNAAHAIRPAHLFDVREALVFGVELLRYVYEFHDLTVNGTETASKVQSGQMLECISVKACRLPILSVDWLRTLSGDRTYTQTSLEANLCQVHNHRCGLFALFGSLLAAWVLCFHHFTDSFAKTGGAL